MQNYVGTKVVDATAMTRGEYNLYQGWVIPEDENPNDEGYLVEYVGTGNPNHPNHKNYISWSPKATFEDAYKLNDGEASFGVALALLKTGQLAVARRDWVGTGMFLYYVPEGEYQPIVDIAKASFGNTVPYTKYIAKRLSSGQVMAWDCNQEDLLAEDWVIVNMMSS